MEHVEVENRYNVEAAVIATFGRPRSEVNGQVTASPEPPARRAQGRSRSAAAAD